MKKKKKVRKKNLFYLNLLIKKTVVVISVSAYVFGNSNPHGSSFVSLIRIFMNTGSACSAFTVQVWDLFPTFCSLTALPKVSKEINYLCLSTLFQL